MSIQLIDVNGDEIMYTQELMLKPREAAGILRIDPRTLYNWAKEGKIAYTTTMGGHHRYPEHAVLAALRGDREGAKAVSIVKQVDSIKLVD